MTDHIGIIEDHCENLKCCADRLLKRAANCIEDGATQQGKAFAALANRVYDSREAILLTAEELNRLARRRESGGQPTVAVPPPKGALTEDMIAVLDAAATEAAKEME